MSSRYEYLTNLPPSNASNIKINSNMTITLKFQTLLMNSQPLSTSATETARVHAKASLRVSLTPYEIIGPLENNMLLLI